MRLFVGIPVEGDGRKVITRATADCRARFPKVRWVRPEQLHLTLRFLGEVDDHALDEVMSWFSRAVEGFRLARLEVGHPGMFPTRNGGVVWLEVGPGESLLDLAGRLSGTVAGLEAEKRPTVPHLTLARVRGRAAVKGILQAVEAAVSKAVADPAIQASNRIVLYRSELKPSGAEHHEVKSIALA